MDQLKGKKWAAIFLIVVGYGISILDPAIIEFLPFTVSTLQKIFDVSPKNRTTEDGGSESPRSFFKERPAIDVAQLNLSAVDLHNNGNSL